LHERLLPSRKGQSNLYWVYRLGKTPGLGSSRPRLSFLSRQKQELAHIKIRNRGSNKKKLEPRNKSESGEDQLYDRKNEGEKRDAIPLAREGGSRKKL